MKDEKSRYVDFAEYYDYDHDISEDIDFYLIYARQCGPPVLDLACGTGRLLVPLAEAGYEIWGVDISENMLAVCHKRLWDEGLEHRVKLVQDNISSFDLPRKDFRLIFIGLRSFMHLLTRADQIACLRQVQRHLHTEGIFILSVIVPNAENLAQEPGEEFVVRREFDLPNGNHVMRKNRLATHDVNRQVRCFEMKFEEYNPEKKLIREKLVPLHTRYMLPGELEALLKDSGYQVMESFGDHERNPFTGTGDLIIVAQRQNGV
jgi:ubiquinone/menaquinone biosynthesis C-methylase UbiE